VRSLNEPFVVEVFGLYDPTPWFTLRLRCKACGAVIAERRCNADAIRSRDAIDAWALIDANATRRHCCGSA
jgi:hypothetical protein